ncbi:MAG: GNAT family N-acetyltransferase [Desulfatitalea sp.]|nr:GNAT family N-acetyltransferase [Desulfatitalea sp.]MBI5895202.1 GNAT family N-acetyltransferase [Desulfobacterales bacterium]
MSIHHLERIFHPRSVAVIGASERPQTVGTVLMRNLIEAGYAGEIHPVNNRYRTLWGRSCHRSIADIGAPVDLAVIATRITTVPRIVQQCAQAGVGGAVIISAGGKETGGHGAEMEAQIRAAAAGSNLRILGPSSLGVACARCNLNVTAAHRLPPAGRLAFISQSGALATSIFDSADKEGIGFSYFVSLGSMMDVEFGDAIDYLGNDPRVSSIVMYMEQLNSGRRFMSAARAVSRIKPIIALKAGRTAPGEQAAARHTGAETGEDAVYDAAFKRAGILRVRTFEELFDCAELVAKHPRPQKAGLIIVSNAGGPAVMAADALGDHGVETVALSAETTAQLEQILSPLWSRANPVDIRGDATPQRYLEVVDCLLKAPETDGLLVMLAPHALSDPTHTAHLLVERLQSSGIPVVTTWLGGMATERGREIFNLAGIPTFDSPERAVRAFMDLYHYGRNLEMLQQIPVKLPGRLTFDQAKVEAIIQEQLRSGDPYIGETKAKQLLEAYGIPVNPTLAAADADQAAAIADQLGYPVVLKVDSPAHAHKSHWGGVRLNLVNEAAVRQAYAQLTASGRSQVDHAQPVAVTVQPMVGPASAELCLGIKKDGRFGPVLTFGWGGAATEIAADQVVALPPINRLLARRMVEGTKIHRLLRGYQDHAPADLQQLEEILIRLGRLATDFAEIQSLEINPLMVVNATFRAVSTRVRVHTPPVPAPFHLVIAPYPNQYEMNLAVNGLGTVLIRPIRPEDAPLLQGLFATLSARSIYFRFFTPLKEIPSEMLARFTQIDYDREIAMVAIHEGNGQEEEMLAVGRIIKGLDPSLAEFAILVGDRWHGKGIGAALLRWCLKIAKSQGVRDIWGTVVSDNTQMIVLGRKLKFKIQRQPDSGEYEFRLDLSQLPDDV